MQGSPGPAPRPQLGRSYFTPMIERSVRVMPLPIAWVIVHESPRLREMKSERPPRYSVAVLCGDKRIGEFQLNCIGVPAGGGLRMFPRPS